MKKYADDKKSIVIVDKLDHSEVFIVYSSARQRLLDGFTVTEDYAKEDAFCTRKVVIVLVYLITARICRRQ